MIVSCGAGPDNSLLKYRIFTLKEQLFWTTVPVTGAHRTSSVISCSPPEFESPPLHAVIDNAVIMITAKRGCFVLLIIFLIYPSGFTLV